jgi:hypothetical protein
MAVIYLIHPVHGAKVAISEHEAIYDEMNGWMQYDPTTPVQAADDDDEEGINELAPKRRGRPRVKQED